MKQAKIIALTAAISAFAFSAVLYTSCSKDKCKDTSCQNGVTSCIDGTCQCPTGYSGNFCELSSITFRNNTFTPVYINVSGYPATIPVDSSVSFSGTSGESVSIFAYTFGSTSTNPRVGDSIIWVSDNSFPVNGNINVVPFNVNENYFYLKMKNTDPSQSIIAVYANYMITGAQTLDSVIIPNDGNVYGIGYYVTYPLTEIYAVSNTGNHWSWSPSINDTVTNSTVTVTVP